MSISCITGIRGLYLLYAVVLTSVLLYYRFPADTLEQHMERRLESILPTVQASAGQSTLGFPPCVRLDSLRVVTRENKTEIAALANVELRPDWRTMGLQWALRAEIYGGTIEGRISLFSPLGSFVVQTLTIKALSLEQSPVVAALLQRKVSGKLNFSGEFLEPGNESSMQGKVSIEAGSFGLHKPFLSLEHVDIKNLEFSVSVQKEMTTIQEGILRGADFTASFAGELEAEDGVSAWEINLAGALKPEGELLNAEPKGADMLKHLQLRYREDAVPYTLRGSVQHPIFLFGKS